MGKPKSSVLHLKRSLWLSPAFMLFLPVFLEMMTEDGVFSIITTYLRLAAEGEKVLAFRADEYYWRDLGKPENVKQAAQDLKEKVVLQ